MGCSMYEMFYVNLLLATKQKFRFTEWGNLIYHHEKSIYKGETEGKRNRRGENRKRNKRTTEPPEGNQ